MNNKLLAGAISILIIALVASWIFRHIGFIPVAIAFLVVWYFWSNKEKT
jgi:Ca2+-dependent lipid-binding protein